ncbi:MAG: hypothetical protein JEZ09_05965 [Salinivirgaceae bacterium]|nr:hypothetical protein [Salinivirgaceae bacterium]
MYKILVFVAFLSLLFTKGFAQESKIENTQLQLEGDNLIITYDVAGSSTLDNVWLDIKTTSNKIITAITLSGDIGKSITVGTKKRIIWNMRADGIDLQGEELNVKVLATKPYASTNTLTDITEIARGKQNKSRDKIVFNNGNQLNGKLDQRFARINFKFLATDGNSLTLKPAEIKVIRSKKISKDSVLLKNGDIVCGSITEIYPNDKITLQSKTNDKYSIQSADIKTVSTYCTSSTLNGKGYFAMPFCRGIIQHNSVVLGLKIGVLNDWGYHAQLGLGGGYNYGIGVSTYLFDAGSVDIHFAFGVYDGGYLKYYTDYSGYYEDMYNYSGADIGFIGQARHFVFNIGVGLPLNVSFGIGYCISAK